MQNKSKRSSTKHGYTIEVAPEAFTDWDGVKRFTKELIPRRRSDPVRPWTYLTKEESFAMIDEVCGLWTPEYVGCSTFEMFMRPIPHTTPLAEFAPLDPILDEMLPLVKRFIFRYMRTGVQSYERRSRLGYPYFNVPPDKVRVIMPDLLAYAEGNLSLLDHAFITANVRLQPEVRDKVRMFMFINAEGRIFEQEISGKERYDEKIGRTASRTRLVFNEPVINLGTQIADNIFHKSLLQHPMFHRNMMGWAETNWVPPQKYVEAFDFSHFERYTGYVTSKWAPIVGGIYGEAISRMLGLPYLVPAVGSGKDNFKPFFITHTDKQSVPQLGSGLSVVSGVQKIFMLALYGYYFSEKRKIGRYEAIEYVAAQRGPTVIHNYGDDNFLASDDSAELEDLFMWLKGMLPVEKEDPKAFLGMEFKPSTGFELMAKKYIMNWFLAERNPGTLFRPYPEHGWRARNKIYELIGDPRVRSDIMPKLIGDILPKYGITPEYRDDRYMMEAKEMGLNRVAQPVWEQTLGKQYLMTDEEKEKFPDFYTILGNDVVTHIFNKTVPLGA